MGLRIQQTVARRQTTLMRLAGLTLGILAVLGLGSCDYEQTSSAPGGSAGFGLTLVAPPGGIWREAWDVSSDSTLHAYLYRLGEDDDAPYAVRPDPDDGASVPEAQGSALTGQELVLEVNRPGTPTWYRLFVKRGSVAGQSTFRLSSSDREREVMVVTAPDTASANRLAAYAGLEAVRAFPHSFGSGDASVVLFPMGVENPNPIDGLRIRFSLDVSQTPRLFIDPGSRLYASYATHDTTAFAGDIELISSGESGCNIFELVISQQTPQATVPAGSDVLFYLASDGSNATSGLCIDRNQVFFSTSGVEERLPEANVTNNTDCTFSDCDLTLTYPSSGDHLCEGEAVTITWTSSGCCGDEVGIELLQDGALCATLTSQTSDDGSYSWTAASCGGSTTGYSLRISSLTTGATDETSGTFDINPECSLGIGYPNGGESLCENGTATITWNAASCCGDNASIQLFLDGELCGTIATSTDNDGSYDWTVASCTDAESGYTIRVTDLDSGVSDDSDATFGILPDCQISVTAPTSEATLCDGSTVTITWEAATCCGSSVSIDLLIDGEQCESIASLTDNDGTHSWTVDPCTYGDGFTIQITDLTTGAEGESDEFNIEDACVLTLTYPDDGGSFCEGQTVNILWNSTTCCASQVKVELLQDGAVCNTLAASATNTGTFAWTVGACGTQTGGYAVRITDETTGVTSESSTTFSILPSCDLAITNPIGGDTLCSDETVNITWTSSDCCGDQVTIALLQEDVVCATLVSGTDDDGSYSWLPTPCDSEESGYTLRITDDTSGTQVQMTGTFSIETSCALDVISPIEATSYCVGTDIDIRWTRSDCCGDSVKIGLLVGGQPCATITASTPNDGAYDWPAAQCGELTGEYTLKITDLEDSTEALSDGFWIHPTCTLLITQPTGTASLCEGEDQEITWNASTCCGENVKITLSYQEDQCVTIAASTPNDGSYTWPVAACGAYGTGYSLRIEDVDTGAFAQTPSTLRIQDACSLNLLAPDAGAQLCEGLIATMTWVAGQCCSDSVRIEALRDDTVYQILAEKAPNTGSFAWIPTRLGQFSDGYSVQIVDPSLPLPVESGLFTISPPCVLAITYPNQSESFCADDTLTITWDKSSCCGLYVALDLYRQGSYCQSIATSTINDGTYPWVMSQCSGESDGYAVQVTDLASFNTDLSNNTFSIAPPCAVTVTDPFGGGFLIADTQIALGWETGSCCGQLVKIELLNDGEVCEVIAASTPNDGGEPWVVERCGPLEDGYTFRVTDLMTSAYGDTPDTYQILSVAPCVINVTQPYVDSSYDEGDAVAIRWDYDQYCGADVMIDLYDNGEHCMLIDSSVNINGSYNWDAVACNGYSNDYSVRVRDNDTHHYDLSPEFEIIPGACILELIEPNGGEDYFEEELVLIRWNVLGECGATAMIELLQYGEYCWTISDSTSNDGLYDWDAETCDGFGDGLTIKVIDTFSGTTEESDAYFTVTPFGKHED